MCIRDSQTREAQAETMNDQSPNSEFKASSFMQGHNAEYLEQLYAQYANDPKALDETWQEFSRLWGMMK